MRSPSFQDRLVVAGATGALGNEVLRLVAGLQLYRDVQVLAREPITAGLRGVGTHVVGDGPPGDWPVLAADAAVVMFEPPRLFYQRERALWTPQAGELLPLARWLRAGGVTTLAIVLPHTQMRLPEALKRGLADLDEHAIAMLAFDRLLIVRSAQAPQAAAHRNVLQRIAHGMLAVGKYMVPSSEQPVRAVKVAQFVAHALRLAPPGIHVAASETVWQAAQGDVGAAVAAWLDGKIPSTP
ncbi:hypothetical protein [Ramlibacter sp. PS4R-6]|uniref:hypothetical protein n=1 Tax=Ramlibacter sp. PS4R-6 TaxID=3133438 RepID=UPI0030AA7B7A